MLGDFCTAVSTRLSVTDKRMQTTYTVDRTPCLDALLHIMLRYSAAAHTAATPAHFSGALALLCCCSVPAVCTCSRVWDRACFEPEEYCAKGRFRTWRGGLQFRAVYKAFMKRFPDGKHILGVWVSPQSCVTCSCTVPALVCLFPERLLSTCALTSVVVLIWSDGVRLTIGTRSGHPYKLVVMNIDGSERWTEENTVCAHMPSLARDV
jgi:hypothetical protein